MQLVIKKFQFRKFLLYCVFGLDQTRVSSFLGHPVDTPCRSFVNLKSNKSGMKLIEFLNQNFFVSLNRRKLGDT